MAGGLGRAEPRAHDLGSNHPIHTILGHFQTRFHLLTGFQKKSGARRPRLRVIAVNLGLLAAHSGIDHGSEGTAH